MVPGHSETTHTPVNNTGSRQLQRPCESFRNSPLPVPTHFSTVAVTTPSAVPSLCILSILLSNEETAYRNRSILGTLPCLGCISRDIETNLNNYSYIYYRITSRFTGLVHFLRCWNIIGSNFHFQSNPWDIT
jgi:hypothetical protein